MVPTARDFEIGMRVAFRVAEAAGLSHVDIRAGDLHTDIGSYPGPDHRMPVCCRVMRELMLAGDRILKQPPAGAGANLVVRYMLPRKSSSLTNKSALP